MSCDLRESANVTLPSFVITRASSEISSSNARLYRSETPSCVDDLRKSVRSVEVINAVGSWVRSSKPSSINWSSLSVTVLASSSLGPGGGEGATAPKGSWAHAAPANKSHGRERTRDLYSGACWPRCELRGSCHWVVVNQNSLR